MSNVKVIVERAIEYIDPKGKKEKVYFSPSKKAQTLPKDIAKEAVSIGAAKPFAQDEETENPEMKD